MRMTNAAIARPCAILCHVANWCWLVKPNEDPNIRGDAFKTLIVARLSYEADERDLEREFGRFGPIERVRIPPIYASYPQSLELT